MAKFLKSNPDIMGEDLGNLALLGIGMGVTAYGNDKLLSPVVSKMIPGMASSGIVQKLADSVTTGLTAWALRAVIGLADHGIARQMARGGLVLAVAKAISAFIPGFSLSANLSLPSVPTVVQLNPPKNGTSNGTSTSGTQALAKLGVGSMGL